MRRLLLTLALLLGALPAFAQPSLTPKRDYAATYRMEGMGPVGGTAMSIAYSAALKMQRMEGGPMGGVMLLNPTTGTLTMLQPELRSYMELTGGRADQAPWLDSNRYRFERTGSDRVANTACTVWKMMEGTTQRGTVCATDDGIMLRAEFDHDGNHGKIEATSFALATQPPENFRVPAGYTKMEMPGMPPGMGRPPRRQ